MYSISSAVRTNKGKIRENNEDNFYINDTYVKTDEANIGCAYRKFSADDYQIYAVCDGMGGCEAGELAAHAVASNLGELKELMKTANKKSLPKRIISFLESMNQKCREISAGSDTAKGGGAGCAVSMICISKKHIFVINAGDSRVYLWRKNKLAQLSYDHTYAQFLYSRGEISKERLENHPQSHVLFQYIGIPENYKFEPYISAPFKIKKGDAFILCSDGLTDMVGNEYISETLSKFAEPGDVCKALVSKALANGGNDNVTVMAVKCVSRGGFISNFVRGIRPCLGRK